MKNVFLGIVLGISLTITPDLISIYDNYISNAYKAVGCKGLEPNQCFFNQNGWYDKYSTENPTLSKISKYFILGEGPLYYVLTGRCSNKIHYNPSATNGSGKMTRRNYFFSRCSRFMNDISDVIYQDADKEQDFDPNQGTF